MQLHFVGYLDPIFVKLENSYGVFRDIGGRVSVVNDIGPECGPVCGKATARKIPNNIA